MEKTSAMVEEHTLLKSSQANVRREVSAKRCPVVLWFSPCHTSHMALLSPRSSALNSATIALEWLTVPVRLSSWYGTGLLLTLALDSPWALGRVFKDSDASRPVSGADGKSPPTCSCAHGYLSAGRLETKNVDSL
ncbi:hypothetical protein RRG08_017962 [Elysia crispata]|uniref:Uncharacterized protein n=1 Tax=Elysia crispata TaxID=231223 RepID=A0AAE0ZD51_9GAST|nr:hypothetical protein RRG08_017962 [Elysia crispata]